MSLIGIAFGIFCIIGVLATVGSLEGKIQSDIKSLAAILFMLTSGTTVQAVVLIIRGGNM